MRMLFKRSSNVVLRRESYEMTRELINLRNLVLFYFSFFIRSAFKSRYILDFYFSKRCMLPESEIN